VDDEMLANVARALAHPARVRIVRLLAEQTECRGADVFSELPLAQSTISEHLRILKEAGLVNSRPVGTATVYCLAPGVLDDLSSAVSGIASGVTKCSGKEAC
jgi:ArsR family transcriptional regulator, arsenate/arsenite/antimonite-responsive transcriptional repressor